MTITDQIKNSTALQAVVGAGDLVVERLRQADVQERVDALIAELRELPEQLRSLPDKAQATTAETISAALNQALIAYGDLAQRGEHLVDRIRRQQATQDTAAHARTTVQQAKATSTTAKKSARKTARKRTAATAKKAAKKSSATTRSRAKATSTSARKTAASARKATTDAANKVGK